MLISESPYNFPNNTATTVPQFIINHLQCNLIKAFNKFTINPTNPASMPNNIFEFIYLTFLPIFQRTQYQNQNWANEFLNRIYWTHYGKRTPKLPQGGMVSKSRFKQCFPLLKEEICAIDPDLIIFATSLPLPKFFNNKNYTLLESCQEININGGRFISHKICCKVREVAIFPIHLQEINIKKLLFIKRVMWLI